MRNTKGCGKFLFGAALGAGLGLLFAPKKGSDMREDLKKQLDKLLNQIKDIDTEEVKKEFDKRVNEIKVELADLDKEKALDLAKEKALVLKDKVEDLVDLAVEKGTPVLRDAAEELRVKAIAVTKDVLKKLEKEEKK